MDRKIRIEECGELTIVDGPGTGKPVMCCRVARMCYTHCAAFGMTAGNVALGAAPSLHCNAAGDGVRIGYLETVTVQP
jgi:hypothetical protein